MKFSTGRTLDGTQGPRRIKDPRGACSSLVDETGAAFKPVQCCEGNGLRHGPPTATESRVHSV